MANPAVPQQPRSNLREPGSATGNGTGARARNSRARDGNGRVDETSLARVEEALRSAAAGDFSVRLPGRRRDALGRLESAYNELAARNAALEAELVRVAG